MSARNIIIIIGVIIGIIFIVKMTNINKQGQDNKINTSNAVNVEPISHASLILYWSGKSVYVDPVGELKMFEGLAIPDMILLTDIHGDHLDIGRLKVITAESTIIVAPQAVADQLPEELKTKTLVMNNGEQMEKLGFQITAIPMYNLPESSTAFHSKGRGNGYLLQKNGTSIYISGDSSGIPEMKNLKNIDMAFVAMNLPYTMSVEEAADAVLAFKPKKVYPYHYRTPTGFSDVAKFKSLANAGNPNIEVVQLEWYPK